MRELDTSLVVHVIVAVVAVVVDVSAEITGATLSVNTKSTQ
jgi:hypothetical protein